MVIQKEKPIYKCYYIIYSKMAKTNRKRWGKEKKYPRNWKAYNEELVRRGTFYLDFEWVMNWNKELAEMNKGKVGSPFLFPESLIKLQAVWLQLVDLRSVEGMTRDVVKIGGIPEYNDYTTISRRVTAMSTSFSLPKGKEVYVATDGTGIKMNMSGEYFDAKYGNGKKKFIKVTISADPYTKELLKCDVSLEGEELSEPQVAMTHIAELEAEGHHVLKFWGDGAFDVHELFDVLDCYGIQSAIKIRENAAIDPGGSVKRNIEVAKYHKLGYEIWARKTEYGRRWTGTEGIISAVKRKFTERIRARKEENMLKEAKRKFWAYEMVRKYARA
jgi:hypothetical protein